MSADNDDVLVEFSLHGKADTSPLIFISEKKRAYYRRIEKAARGLAAAQREFYDALNDRAKEPEGNPALSDRQALTD